MAGVVVYKVSGFNDNIMPVYYKNTYLLETEPNIYDSITDRIGGYLAQTGIVYSKSKAYSNENIIHWFQGLLAVFLNVSL